MHRAAQLLSAVFARARNSVVHGLPEVLEGDELQILEDTVRQYETAVGRALNFEGAQAGEQPAGSASMPVEPSQPSAFFQVQSQSGGRSFRIHGQDLQLTFNHGPWRAQNQNAEDWFASQGVHLVARFQTWALEELPQKFRETILHMSLTLEESLHAAGDSKRVHLHAQITFKQRIDRTSVLDFVFEGVRPHVAAR